MPNSRPIIGISAGFDYSENRLFINNGYIEAIRLAGGLPVLLPVTNDTELLKHIIGRFDGFLLSGGSDVDARFWGEPNYTFGGEISPLRDEPELFIAREAIAADKPILGICRGCQVMNIAMGGTIYQDIYAQQVGKEIYKHSQNAPKWYPTHDIFIEKDTKVFKAHQEEIIRVNSFHHQAVKDVAPGFIVSSRCGDGIVESIEHISCKFAVGVQWHPELMWEKDNTYLKIFVKFVALCK
ncbi:gamma-glutamyl-gamma-aminobutyrate hydrolase family protein [Acetivibrio cellulolyticus]|uniref:gamma-glutamyl-gamma-aminobutyrate hydrolase family protein n=1 Tax=Acetivibrio cellulolyticus TaxID=35830 RepID=UPI0001E2E367|nr:gamma-glutamyl-gamma-aminobutyrate hydrolase family protein [Acetivibrio cellulolyticus]